MIWDQKGEKHGGTSTASEKDLERSKRLESLLEWFRKDLEEI